MIWWPVHLRPTRLNADVDTSMSQDSISFEGSCSLALPRFSPHCRNSENSKANRIETMKGPAESGQICSVGRRKIAKKIAKNKRCYANTLRPRSSGTSISSLPEPRSSIESDPVNLVFGESGIQNSPGCAPKKSRSLLAVMVLTPKFSENRWRVTTSLAGYSC